MLDPHPWCHHVYMYEQPLAKIPPMENKNKEDQVRYELMSPVSQVPIILYYYYMYPMKINKAPFLQGSADSNGGSPDHEGRRLVTDAQKKKKLKQKE